MVEVRDDEANGAGSREVMRPRANARRMFGALRMARRVLGSMGQVG